MSEVVSEVVDGLPVEEVVDVGEVVDGLPVGEVVDGLPVGEVSKLHYKGIMHSPLPIHKE